MSNNLIHKRLKYVRFCFGQDKTVCKFSSDFLLLVSFKCLSSMCAVLCFHAEKLGAKSSEESNTLSIAVIVVESPSPSPDMKSMDDGKAGRSVLLVCLSHYGHDSNNNNMG